VHLLKVKAHSGVIGNERADALARQAAHLGDLCPTGLTFEPNPFEGRTWLRAGKHILANVSSAVKDAMMTHRLGAANQESLYFTSWKAAAEAAVPESLELIMSDKVPPAQRKLALQYRTGSMWNQKLAFRFGRARTANCPCCSKPDSATHILSGPCAPQHSLMVTSRHNGAVGIVAKALRDGSRGAEICFVDAITPVDEEGEHLPQQRRWKGLLADLRGGHQSSSSRPDIVLQGPTGVTLVELKFCADTRWQDQLHRAEGQHATLLEGIRRHTGADVKLHVILIGVVGTCYTKYTLEPLIDLGLAKADAHSTLCKLSLHALEHAQKLRRTSYALRGGPT
jgi:hypothetical protein